MAVEKFTELEFVETAVVHVVFELLVEFPPVSIETLMTALLKALLRSPHVSCSDVVE